MTTDYQTLNQQLTALIHGVPHRIANLANAAALLFHTMEEINWAGFYLLESDILVLGPFQGKHACIEIPIGRGVCGTAAAEDKTQLVHDVHQFPGHIACDSASIFYPGGKVEHTAYVPLLRACAERGILCVLVQMPCNLAVLNVNGADGIRERFSEIDR